MRCDRSFINKKIEMTNQNYLGFSSIVRSPQPGQKSTHQGNGQMGMGVSLRRSHIQSESNCPQPTSNYTARNQMQPPDPCASPNTFHLNSNRLPLPEKTNILPKNLDPRSSYLSNQETRPLYPLNLDPRTTHPSNQDKLNFNSLPPTPKNTKNQFISSERLKQVISDVIESQLPHLVKEAVKHLVEDVKKIRLEIETTRNQFKAFEKKQNQLTNNYQFKFKTINSFISQIKNPPPQLKELDKKYNILENKLKQMGKELTGQAKGIKISNMYSSLPSLIVEYKESLICKNKELLLNKTIYYLDKLGNLMDSENRYIIDQKGTHIKLNEQQVKVLVQNKMLT